MDIRPFPPTERHEMFYKAFADIKPGEAFEFINDHDPKPLYYQMEQKVQNLLDGNISLNFGRMEGSCHQSEKTKCCLLIM
jgi:uncharacterized protein (DUF2249 family)